MSLDAGVRPGETIDRYVVECELGHGGMGIVYLVRDTKHDRHVALKVLRPELACSLVSDYFLDEIRLAAQLQHPHILALYDSGDTDGLLYYVMPYVAGESLRDRIDRLGMLDVSEAIEIAGEIADALDYAHTRGILHRDIKPGNILVSGGHAWLADFGIARALSRAGGDTHTSSSLAVGTPAYVSPEQAAGGNVDARSDVYALGCVLYEMLVGKPAFTGSTPLATILLHSTAPVPSVRAARPSVDESLEHVVAKALAKSRDDRWASARDFALALRGVGKGETVAAPPPLLPTPSPLPATPSRGRLKRRLLVVGAIALAAIPVATQLLRAPTGETALDATRVMLFPLVSSGELKTPATIGEDVATLIGSALNDTGPLRWIDAWPLLEPRVRDNIRLLTLASSSEVARSQRCAYYLRGRVIERGDSAEVVLELRDARADSVVATGKASGQVADAWRLGLRAVNDLLPALVSGSPGVSAEWKDRAPAAVANFLLGEAAFRRARLTEALIRYRDAVKSDSAFALAAIRGAQAATWNHRPSEAVALIHVALQHPMPARHTHFARGYAAYLDGKPDTAAAELRRALALDPEMAAAWVQLGEVYTHLLPRSGAPDSIAEVAFEEARKLDPTASNTLLHLIEIRLRAGDTLRAGPLVRQFLAGEPDSTLAEQVKIMERCVGHGAAAVAWAQAVRTHPLAVLTAAKSLMAAGHRLACAEAGFSAILDGDTATATDTLAAKRRWTALLGLESTLLSQRRAAEAAARLDASIARGEGGSSLFLVGAGIVPELEERGRSVAQADAKTFGPSYGNCPYPIRLWALALWEAHAGSPTVVAAIARNLEGQARASGARGDSLLAHSAAAYSALARRDTSGALARLSALVPNAPPGPYLEWDIAEPLGYERLTYARLLLATGRAQQALETASVFDSSLPIVYVAFLPASLELRAEAATALGRADLAAHYRERLAALRPEKLTALR